VHRELEPEEVLGHGGALDVPAGPPLAPRAGPAGVLVVLAPLPQREVEAVLLEIVGAGLLPLVHLVRITVGELAVGGVGAHPEVHVAARLVRVARDDQRLDQLHDRLDRLRRLRLVVGAAEAETVRVGGVVGDHLLGVLSRGHSALPSRVVDLVVDVGEVDHQGRPVALVLEEPPQDAEDDVGPRVADVDRAVGGRAARVDADLAGRPGLERPHLARQRVLKPHLAQTAGDPTARLRLDNRGGRVTNRRRRHDQWPRR
jgi:hypothetical protein